MHATLTAPVLRTGRPARSAEHCCRLLAASPATTFPFNSYNEGTSISITRSRGPISPHATAGSAASDRTRVADLAVGVDPQETGNVVGESVRPTSRPHNSSSTSPIPRQPRPPLPATSRTPPSPPLPQPPTLRPSSPTPPSPWTSKDGLQTGPFPSTPTFPPRSPIPPPRRPSSGTASRPCWPQS